MEDALQAAAPVAWALIDKQHREAA
jgi:hypothetical protein